MLQRQIGPVTVSVWACTDTRHQNMNIGCWTVSLVKGSLVDRQEVRAESAEAAMEHAERLLGVR